MTRWTSSALQEQQFSEIIDELYSTYINRIEGLPKPESMPFGGIPRIFHFIWLGTSELPSFGAEFIESWKRYHPGWALEFWDDTRAASFWSTTASCRTKECFESANNFGMKSDILRYELLYHLGGIYADIDYECLGSFDEIVLNCTFFAGRANVPAFPSIEINNGLIGCCAGHPLMNSIIEKVAKNMPGKSHQNLNVFTNDSLGTNGALMAFLGGADQFNLKQVVKSNDSSDTISTTGPGMLTRTLCDSLLRDASAEGYKGSINNAENIDSVGQTHLEYVLILPQDILNPLPNSARLKIVPDVNCSDVRAPFVTDRSLAVHYWQSTWA